MKKQLIIICGPTGIGKTTAAIQVAKHFKTEIISADSRQIYKEISIGTAKPSLQELETVPHHFINYISIHDDYSAGKYEEDAISLLNNLFIARDIVVAAGGTNLYINAICQGFDDIPKVDPMIRKKIIAEFKQNGLEHLQSEVKKADPESYKSIDINNPQRLMRILEVFRGSGKKVSDLKSASKKERNFNVVKIGLEMDRERLYNRINNRVDKMISNGLLEEVENLKKYRHLNALQTVGYKELFDYLDGTTTLETAIELIKRNSRRYAKRQLTWLRKDDEVNWFEAGNIDGMIGYLRA